MGQQYYIFMEYMKPLFPFLILGTTGYFARRFVRALEQRSESKAELAELRARLATLEETVDGTERDIMRVQAAQDFSARLLSTRLTSE